MARKALSSAQEARLIRHLDESLLQLSGKYEGRHGTSSPLQTLEDFLDALLPLLSFILTIPSAPPSSDIRIAYLLQLTGFLPPALDGYTILDHELDKLFNVLAQFERGWIAVLEVRDWDSARGQASEGPGGGGKMRTTDRVRLESLIKEIKAVLAISLGLPEFVPLENDPFQELLKQQEGRRQPVRLEDLKQPQREREAAEGEEAAMEPVSTASTPSLVPDSDEAMSVDTAVATPSSASIVDDDGDEEGSDSEFEEVLPAADASTSAAMSLSSPTASLPTAYADAPSADGSFVLHFTGPPPPTLQDGELSLGQGETPIVGQSRGFDPDEEYPPEDEVGERVGEERMSEEEAETEDGMEESTRERVKAVFAEAEKVLARLRSEAS
ncbi:hypothetical protein JCM6882_000300 [Rhodosporidiobolus microsporus]